MERITFTLDNQLLALVDGFASRRGYPSRSEAIRELLRDAANRERTARGSGPCLATLTYVFDHATRELAQKLTDRSHDHHDIAVSTTHIHVDHDSCLEVAILRGPIAQVHSFSEEITAQRGVRHAALHVIPVAEDAIEHSHGPGQPRHRHDHA